MAFCSNCGTRVEDGAHFCPECGTALNDPQQTPQENPSKLSVPQEAENSNYQQLGGWLLFFVVCWALGALSGLSTLAAGIRTLFSFSPGFILSALFTIVEGLLTVGIGALLVVLVIQRNPLFLRVYQFLSIAEVAVGVVSRLLSRLFAMSQFGVGFISIGGGIVGGIIGLCLMTLYFCRSKRVRAYMGSTEYLDQAIFRLR